MIIGNRKSKSLLRKYNNLLCALIGHIASARGVVEDLHFNKSSCPDLVLNYMDTYSDVFQGKDGCVSDFEHNIGSLIQRAKIHSGYVQINKAFKDSFVETLNSADWKRDFIRDINYFAEPIGNLSNTCLFRHINIKDRRISIVNQRIPKSTQDIFKKKMLAFSSNMYNFYDIFFLNENSPIRPSVTGFIKGKSYVSHALEHLGCRSAISVDISKFYDSISINSIIENNLFYKSLIASFYCSTGKKFELESFSSPSNYLALNNMFAIINVSFITLMNMFSHNGILPTGANYSPIISNILFAPMDLEIRSFLPEDVKYTRYADDICVSTMNAYNDSGNFSLTMDKVLAIEKLVNDSGFYLNYDKTCIMGPRDRKKVAGIILDTSSESPKLSIGSSKKLKLKQEFSGLRWKDLSSSDIGTIEWVRSINLEQYQFIISEISGVPERSNRSPIYRRRTQRVNRDIDTETGYLRDHFEFNIPNFIRARDIQPTRPESPELQLPF